MGIGPSRRRTVLAAVAVATIATPIVTAHASPAKPPPPAVTITTDVGGQQLPASTMRGTWKVKKPGRAADLDVQGAAVSGSSTRIRSTWTSSWRKARGHRRALSVQLGDSYADVAPGTGSNAYGLRIQLRTRQSEWQDLGGGITFDEKFQPLTAGGGGFGVVVSLTSSVVVQWRVLVDATFVDTSTQDLGEQVRIY